MQTNNKSKEKIGPTSLIKDQKAQGEKRDRHPKKEKVGQGPRNLGPKQKEKRINREGKKQESYVVYSL